MADVLLLHHAHGLTEGLLALAGTLREAGHTVHVPDSYDGKTFTDLVDGLGYAEQVGFGAVAGRAVDAAEVLPAGLVYVGFSLGVMPAQQLAQTREGARGAVLVGSCVGPTEFAPRWPEGVPVQVHGGERDEIFVEEGDLDAARELVASVGPGGDADLFLYDTDSHNFADGSLDEYDEAAATLLTERVLAFLARLDGAGS